MSTPPIPDTAFILAAGYGKRLQPHTLEKPKPMVKANGKPMIDHALEKLGAIGVADIIVNTHYKAEILHTHLKDRTNITISHEDELLDTGGGIKKGLTNHHIKEQAFYVISGDSLWDDAPDQNTLTALAQAWNPEEMDILMLLQPVASMTLTKGVGDYDLDKQGRATRSLNQTGGYMFTSIRINAGHIFENTPEGPFSYLKLMDKAQEKGRLYGLIHNGDWHHISTPADLQAVNAYYEKTS